MIQVIPSRVCLWGALMCGWLVASWAGPVSAQVTHQYTFQEMVEQSDQIYIANCVSRQTEMRGGRLVTRYELKPSEVWKGQPRTSAQGTVTMEEYGGTFDKGVPIAQFVPGMADMMQGEDVLLFCHKPKAEQPQTAQTRTLKPKASSLSPQSPIIVGRWQGRYTVFKHPETGQRLVGRPTASTVPGAAVNPNLQKLMIAQNKRSQTGNKTGDAAVQRRMSQRIATAAEQGRKERATAAERDPARGDDIYQYESLDAVRQRVQRVLKEAKK